MAADSAKHTNFPQFNKPRLENSNHVDPSMNSEYVSGFMILVRPNGRRLRVEVDVYRSSMHHFIVIYRPKKIIRPLGVLNLKNTMIERYGDEGFLVHEKDFDSPAPLTFLMEDKKELDYWINAFSARSSPLVHQSSLPVVEED